MSGAQPQPQPISIPLSPAQETLTHLPTEGQFLVRGAAGSGKTTTALARAVHLARQRLLHGEARVLLLARSPALAALLASRRDRIDGALAPRIEVTALAPWTRAFTQSGSELLTPAQSAALIDAALHLVRRRSRSQVLRRPLSFFTTEIESMLLGLGVRRFQDYTPVEREGRGTALDEEARRTIFAVFEEHLAIAARLGRTPPLALAPAAIARLASERRPPYDHVVVDDADRLAPIELKLARALATGGSLTLFAALEQKFDPAAANLRALGLDRLDRTESLTQVVRGPAPIFEAALAVLRKRGASGENGRTTAHAGAIDGPRPRLLLCSGWQQELDALSSELLKRRSAGRPLRDALVLASGAAGLEMAAAALARAGIATRRLDDDSEPAAMAIAAADDVQLATLDAAAGREAAAVWLLDVNRGCYPRAKSQLAEHERAGADDAARRALHLGMTRATQELTLIASAATRSPLLPMKRLAVESLFAVATPAVTPAGA